ncbi:hypothetical protein GCM10018781_45320 [Kitasatospora indigofera]|uniref:Uncharacterized protein n=1 Tax=Kitasatospora indigofera TaxID=67307 RepID=A0A919KWY2_9ACTN|nr:hypothetical protein GCM10018781_45320 [Kitasatospora indigofera]
MHTVPFTPAELAPMTGRAPARDPAGPAGDEGSETTRPFPGHHGRHSGTTLPTYVHAASNNVPREDIVHGAVVLTVRRPGGPLRRISARTARPKDYLGSSRPAAAGPDVPGGACR